MFIEMLLVVSQCVQLTGHGSDAAALRATADGGCVFTLEDLHVDDRLGKPDGWLCVVANETAMTFGVETGMSPESCTVKLTVHRGDIVTIRAYPKKHAAGRLEVAARKCLLEVVAREETQAR